MADVAQDPAVIKVDITGAQNYTRRVGVDANELAVHGATKLPDLKTWGGENRKFYVSVIDASQDRDKRKETRAICSEGNAVEWNQRLVTL